MESIVRHDGRMEHHPVPTTVLWDIDGTLVMNASSPGNLYHLALERAVGRDLTLRVGHQHGRRPLALRQRRGAGQEKEKKEGDKPRHWSVTV